MHGQMDRTIIKSSKPQYLNINYCLSCAKAQPYWGLIQWLGKSFRLQAPSCPQIGLLFTFWTMTQETSAVLTDGRLGGRTDRQTDRHNLEAPTMTTKPHYKWELTSDTFRFDRFNSLTFCYSQSPNTSVGKLFSFPYNVKAKTIQVYRNCRTCSILPYCTFY